MANTAQIARDRIGYHRGPGRLAPVPALRAADDRGDIRLIRNEAMQEALGGRTWIGALVNATGCPHDDVSVQIRFHDQDGRIVGAPVTGHAARLRPGAALHLQARLPSAAVGLWIHLLGWAIDGQKVALGPFRRRSFGSIQT